MAQIRSLMNSIIEHDLNGCDCAVLLAQLDYAIIRYSASQKIGIVYPTYTHCVSIVETKTQTVIYTL